MHMVPRTRVFESCRLMCRHDNVAEQAACARSDLAASSGEPLRAGAQRQAQNASGALQSARQRGPASLGPLGASIQSWSAQADDGREGRRCVSACAHCGDSPGPSGAIETEINALAASPEIGCAGADVCSSHDAADSPAATAIESHAASSKRTDSPAKTAAATRRTAAASASAALAAIRQHAARAASFSGVTPTPRSARGSTGLEELVADYEERACTQADGSTHATPNIALLRCR